jgi:hypothetical protein
MREFRETVEVSCPGCSAAVDLESVLLEVAGGTSMTHHVDGGRELRPGGHGHRCAACRTAFVLSDEQVAWLVISRQTRDVMSSISRMLRGPESLH